VGIALTVNAAGTKLPDRKAFCQALGRVKVGMSKWQVEHLVGKPDDLWTDADPDEYCSYKQLVWCYGSDGHLSMPTLGRITFSGSRVLRVMGTSLPDHLTEVPEPDLRRILSAMWGPLSYVDEREEETGRVLRATNLLQPLGKDRALAVLRKFDDLDRTIPLGNEWLFWVPIVLFDPPDPPGYLPFPLIPIYGPDLTDPRELKRFPVLLWQDIPFLCFKHRDNTGPVEIFSKFLDRFENLKTFRTEPLHPANNPFRAYEELIASTTWRPEYLKLESEIRRDMILLAQIPLPYSRFGYFDAPDGFDKARETFMQSGGHWDAKQLRYVRADGSYFEPPSKIRWKTHYWEPFHKPFSLVVRVQRDSQQKVTIDINVLARPGTVLGPALLTVKDCTGAITMFTCQANNSWFSSRWDLSDEAFMLFAKRRVTEGGEGTLCQLELADGQDIVLVAQYDGRTYKSGVIPTSSLQKA